MSFGGGGSSFSGKRGGENEGTFVVLPAMKARWGNDVFKVEIEGDALELSIGAGSLCDAVSTALLLHHAQAIKAGRRPGGSSQAPLDPEGEQGRAANAGHRPRARGFTGNPDSLPNVLTRSAITLSNGEVRIGGKHSVAGPRQKGKRGPTSPNMGFSAVATVGPANNLHAQWLIDQAGQGYEFFSIVGDSDRVVTEAVSVYLGTITDGPRTYEKRKFQARDAG